jgi:SAM-dependent methyltransferase
MKREHHWQGVYQEKPSDEVSWFAPRLEESLQLITEVTTPTARVIDVGGGASTLVDDLLGRGYRDVTVLDLSSAALDVARRRLGDAGRDVTWIACDVTEVELEPARYDLWHDRAVFHFLTEAADREAYVERARRSVADGGHLVMGTFSLSGPTRCSGLDVVRYDAASLALELGADFELEGELAANHRTPAGREQAFLFTRFRKRTPS